MRLFEQPRLFGKIRCVCYEGSEDPNLTNSGRWSRKRSHSNRIFTFLCMQYGYGVLLSDCSQFVTCTGTDGTTTSEDRGCAENAECKRGFGYTCVCADQFRGNGFEFCEPVGCPYVMPDGTTSYAQVNSAKLFCSKEKFVLHLKDFSSVCNTNTDVSHQTSQIL